MLRLLSKGYYVLDTLADCHNMKNVLTDIETFRIYVCNVIYLAKGILSVRGTCTFTSMLKGEGVEAYE